MTARFRQFWSERSIREKQLLLMMFALFGVMVLVFGIIRPLVNSTTAARERLDRATVEAGQIAAWAQTLRDAKRGAPPALSGTMILAIAQSAGAAGLTLATVDPQGEDRVGFTIPNVKSPAFFAWLRTLSQQGIFPERVTLRTNPDGTLAAEATLRLRK